MSSNKEESMSQSKNTKQSKRRGGLLRLRLRVPAREENATRSRDDNRNGPAMTRIWW